ncbi:MAG: hypothetical protein IPM64_02500 [Phycisphaerales bacterium]|nr:hypothetical protein [Phycisphaerales bacterium]
MSSIHDLPVDALRRRYGLAHFVETGTHLGDGVQSALDCGFEHVHSCDLMEHVVEAAQRRFAQNPRVSLYHADSVAFLREVLPRLSGPAFFWLDAHFPDFYGYPCLPEQRFPLAEELRLIAHHRSAKDVIACDDIRVVADPHNPAFMPGVLERGGHAALVVPDVSIATLAHPLAATHTWRVDVAAEGILLFEPRSA